MLVGLLDSGGRELTNAIAQIVPLRRVSCPVPKSTQEQLDIVNTELQGAVIRNRQEVADYLQKARATSVADDSLSRHRFDSIAVKCSLKNVPVMPGWFLVSTDQRAQDVSINRFRMLSFALRSTRGHAGRLNANHQARIRRIPG